MFKYATDRAFTHGIVPVTNLKELHKDSGCFIKYYTANAITYGIVPVCGVVDDGVSDILDGFNQYGESVRVFAAYLFDTLEEAIDNCHWQAADAVAEYKERIRFIIGIDFAGDFERKQRKAQAS